MECKHVLTHVLTCKDWYQNRNWNDVDKCLQTKTQIDSIYPWIYLR